MAITNEEKLGSQYSTVDLANNALRTLTDVTGTDGLQLYNTDLVSNYYNRMRNDMAADGYMYDRAGIQALMDEATQRAYEQQHAELQQAGNAAEQQQANNTRDAVAQMRRGLAGSASSRANVGAANATALQALLGLGQTNSALSTQALQNVQNTAREKSAAMAQNAVNALTTANDAVNNIYSQANSAYGSDQAAGGERAYGSTQGLGTAAGAVDTAASNERMNSATNRTNQSIAETHTKSTIYNKK